MLSFPHVQAVDCLLRLECNLTEVTIPVASYDVLQHFTKLDNCSSKGKVHRSEQVTSSTEGALGGCLPVISLASPPAAFVKPPGRTIVKDLPLFLNAHSPEGSPNHICQSSSQCTLLCLVGDLSLAC